MTDDIVTRLREQMRNEFVIEHPHMIRVPTLYEQAADEIERLRALISELAKLMMPFALLMTSEEQQKVLKAVRGEQ